MSQPEVLHTASFVDDAVQLIQDAAQEALAARGVFRLSLCGGGTPAAIYRALAKLSDSSIDWSRTVITFGDERCVAPEHERSNYRMAREALLDHVPLREVNVLRMKGELPPSEAAADYESQLKAHTQGADENIFRHDLLLLGMGDDGHTASLFPETEALEENERWVVANHVPKFDEDRITMTYPLINAARRVCFLVTGEAKRPVYEKILSGESSDPAAKIAPNNGQLIWLLGK